MISIDTSLLLRAFSIFAIVANHFGLLSLSGGALYLIALSGFNFVKFTKPKFGFSADAPESYDKFGFLKKYYRFVIKLATPTLLYISALYLLKGEFHPLSLLLISNFVDPHYAGGMSYWFIEVLLQIYILFSLVLLVRPVRKAMTETPYLLFMSLSLLCFLASLTFEALFDSSHLYGRLPHLMLYLFTSGALVATSQTYTQKMTTTLFIIAITGQSLVTSFGDSKTVLLLGLLATLWIPTIRLPALLTKPVKTVALSSLFIYLSHFQAKSLLDKLVGPSNPAIAVATALVTGVILAKLWEHRHKFLALMGTYLHKMRRAPEAS